MGEGSSAFPLPLSPFGYKKLSAGKEGPAEDGASIFSLLQVLSVPPGTIFPSQALLPNNGAYPPVTCLFPHLPAMCPSSPCAFTCLVIITSASMLSLTSGSSFSFPSS